MVCKKCEEDKDEKHFQFNKKIGKYETSCRSCRKGYTMLMDERIKMFEDLVKSGFQKCNRCDTIKPLDEFFTSKNTKFGFMHCCKACSKEKNEIQRENRRKRDLKVKYGLDYELFNELLKAQEYKCELCGDDITNSTTIDHCHETGAFRGLLCGKCNTGLGMFRDNPEVMIAGANYIYKHNKINK